MVLPIHPYIAIFIHEWPQPVIAGDPEAGTENPLKNHSCNTLFNSLMCVKVVLVLCCLKFGIQNISIRVNTPHPPNPANLSPIQGILGFKLIDLNYF